MKVSRTVLSLALAVSAAGGLAAPHASAARSAAAPGHADGGLLSESFRGGATPPGRWRMVSPQGRHTPCLTAATSSTSGSLPACTAGASDKIGGGAFQLTDNSPND